MNLIDKNGTKFKTHIFERNIVYNESHFIFDIKTCSNCGCDIFYPTNNSTKLCRNIFDAIGLQLTDVEFTHYSDIDFSCEEYIIKNIIE